MVADVALVVDESVHAILDEAVQAVPDVNAQVGQFELVKAPDGPYVNVFYRIIEY